MFIRIFGIQKGKMSIWPPLCVISLILWSMVEYSSGNNYSFVECCQSGARPVLVGVGVIDYSGDEVPKQSCRAYFHNPIQNGYTDFTVRVISREPCENQLLIAEMYLDDEHDTNRTTRVYLDEFQANATVNVVFNSTDICDVHNSLTASNPTPEPIVQSFRSYAKYLYVQTNSVGQWSFQISFISGIDSCYADGNFYCHQDGICLDASYVCDGTPDCPSTGQDEQNCQSVRVSATKKTGLWLTAITLSAVVLGLISVVVAYKAYSYIRRKRYQKYRNMSMSDLVRVIDELP